MPKHVLKFFTAAFVSALLTISYAHANIMDDKTVLKQFNADLEELLSLLPDSGLNVDDLNRSRDSFLHVKSSYLILKQVLIRLDNDSSALKALNDHISPLIGAIDSYFSASEQLSEPEVSVLENLWLNIAQYYHFYVIKFDIHRIKTTYRQIKPDILRVALPVTPVQDFSDSLSSGNITPSYLSQIERTTESYKPAIDPIIEDKANQLNFEPVEIYQFVARNISPEFYPGHRKSPVAVLRSGAGNDVDQALLLAQLLIASGYKANPVIGVSNVPLSYVEAIGHISGESSAIQLLRKSGQSFEYHLNSDGTGQFLWQRTWVSAHIPYDSYRGATVNTDNRSWVPLDPFQPQPLIVNATPPLANSFDLDSAISQYLSAPISSFEGSFVSYISHPSDETDSGDIQIQATQNISYLPASLNFDVSRVITEGNLPDDYINKLTITASTKRKFYTQRILSSNFSIAELYNRNITFTFEAATQTDQERISQSGGLNSALLSDINLKLVIRIDDQIVAISDSDITAGSQIELSFNLNNSQRSQFHKTLTSGSFYTLAVGGGEVTSSTEEMTNGANQGSGSMWLSHAAYLYQQRVLSDNRQLEALTGHKVLYPAPTFTFLSNRQKIDFLLDKPVFMDWNGVDIDALMQPITSVIPNNSVFSAADFVKTSALTSSWHEQDVLEVTFGFESISADKFIRLAQNRGDLLFSRNDREQVLVSNHEPHVINEIVTLIDSGYDILIPANPLKINEWTGSGWIATSPTTGATGYYLSGSIAGGTNTNKEGNQTSWTLIDPRSSAIQQGEDRVAYLEAYYDSGATGIAGQSTNIRVRAFTAAWEPVKSADITLYITTGNGSFENGSQSATMQTDNAGWASWELTFASSTNINPHYHYFSTNDNNTFPQRVSEVNINARVGADTSISGKISLLSPIILVYGPDKAIRAEITQTNTSQIRTSAYDQYGNPVSNVPVTIKPDGYDCTVPEVQAGSEEESTLLEYCRIANLLIGDRGEGRVDQLLFYTTSEHAQSGFIFPGEYEYTFYAFNVSVGNLASRRVYRFIFSDISFIRSAINTDYTDIKDGKTENVHCYNSPAINYTGMSSEIPYFALTIPGQKQKGAVTIKPRFCKRTEIKGTDNNRVFSYKYSETDGPNNVTIASKTGQISFSEQINSGKYDYSIDITGTTPGRYVISYSDEIATIPEAAQYYTVKPQIFQKATPATIPHPDGRILTSSPVTIEYTFNQPGLTFGRLPYLYFYEDDILIKTFNSDTYNQKGYFVIPALFPLNKSSDYTLQLVAYPGTSIESRSEKIPLELNIITDYKERLSINNIVRPASNWQCIGSDIDLNLTISRDATIQISIAKLQDSTQGPIEGPEKSIFSAPLAKGRHNPDLRLEEYSEGTYLLRIKAIDGSDIEERTSILNVVVSRLESIPVSHSLYKDINLHDGSLNLIRTDLSVPMNTLALSASRRYNSNQRTDESYLGIGWTDTNLHILTETACGTVTVNGIPFEPSEKGFNAVPGYHGTLIKDANGYDFYTKGGVRYRFTKYPFLQANQWLVEYIQPPSGSLINFSYRSDSDAFPMIDSIQDQHGRKLIYEYTELKNNDAMLSAQRLKAIRFHSKSSAGEVNYTYDNEFRLTSATLNKSGESVTLEQYRYADPVYINTVINNSSNQITNQKVLLQTTSLPHITEINDALGFTTRYTYTMLDLPNSKLAVLLENGKDPFVTDITDRNDYKTNFDYSFEIPNYSNDLNRIAATVTISGQDWNFSQRLNSYGSIIEETSEAGTRKTQWNTQHILPSSVTDRNGKTTSYSYDKHGNEILKSYQLGNKIVNERKTYTSLPTRSSGGTPVVHTALTSRIDGANRKIIYDYENKLCPFPTKQSYPFKKYSYDAQCNLTRETDANDNRFSYTYDQYGYRSSITGPTIGHKEYKESFKHNAYGELISSTDANGFLTHIIRNIYGQPLSIEMPLGKKTYFVHDNIGRTTQKTDTLGRIISFTYDGEGNLLSETHERGCDGSNIATSLLKTYSSRGTLTSETDWNGNKTIYTLDSDDRVISVQQPHGKRTTYTLDGNGNIKREIFTIDGEKAGSINRSFDENNQVIVEIDAEGHITRLGYDLAGNIITKESKNGLVTQYAYDEYNRNISISKDARIIRYTYDLNGRLLEEKDDFKTLKRTWDGLGNEIQTQIISGNSRAEITRSFDPLGNLLSITDEVGDKTSYKYDALSRRTQMTNALNQATDYTYDLAGRMLSQSLPNRNTIRYHYDASDNLIEENDNLGLHQQRTFDCQGNLTSLTDGNGNTTTHRYNSLNQRIRTTLPSGFSEDFTYNHQGKFLTHTNPLGETRSIEYDKRGFTTRETDFNGNITSYKLDADGQPIQRIDSGGNITTTEYNLFSEPVTITDALGQSLSFTYDTLGRQISSIDAAGIVSTTRYNNIVNKPIEQQRNKIVRWRKTYYPDGQLSAEHDALDNKTLYKYDGLKRPILVSGENQSITQYRYSAVPFIRTIITPDHAEITETYDVREQLINSNASGAITHYTYDLAGNQTSVTLPAGQTTHYTYDKLNRMLTVTEPGGEEALFGYDAAGRKNSHTDAAGRKTDFTYDPNGNLLSVLYAGILTTSFSYDNLNRLTSETRPDHGSVQYGYNAIGKMTSQVDSTGTINWHYDRNGNITQTDYTYNNGLIASGTETNQYDAFNRRIRFTDISGLTTQWRYDNNDQITAITYPNGNITTFTWDARQRLSSVMMPRGSAHYSYYADDQIKSVNYSNGASSHYEYTSRNQISSILHTLNSATLANLAYTYDNNDNRLTETKNSGSDSLHTIYQYDSNNRLLKVQYPAQYGVAGKTVDYTYDDNHNRKAESITTLDSGTVTRTYTYNNLDQLTQILSSDSNNTLIDYTYDGNGNLSTKTTSITTDKGTQSTTLNYTFDARGALQQITRGGSTIGQFLYDSNGQRVRAKFQQNDATPLAYQHSLYQGLNLISQYDVDSNNQLSINANYQFHPLQRLFIGREPFAESNTDNNTQTFFHTDALGSILATSKRNQTIAARYDYDAWGNEIHNTGTSDNPLGYTGHQMDRDIGLIYANARYLDPDTGRFLSFDPFEGYDDKPISLNKYLYAYQNPLKYTDPDGKCAEPLTFTLCAIGVTTLAATAYDYFTTDRREQAYAEIRPESIGTGVLTEAYAFSQSAANTLTGGYFDAVRSNTVKEHTLENVLPVDAAYKAYTEFTRDGGDPVLASLYTAKALGQTVGLGLVAAGVKSPGTTRPQTVVESATTVETKFAQTLADNAMSPSRGQMFGQRGAAGDIGAGVTNKAGTETVQRWMSKAELKATQETGLLRGGRDGTHYVTDSANSNALRARQRSALPQTPEVKVTLEVPKGKFSQPSRVEPAFNMPGGGMERTATGNIPVTIKRVQ